MKDDKTKSYVVDAKNNVFKVNWAEMQKISEPIDLDEPGSYVITLDEEKSGDGILFWRKTPTTPEPQPLVFLLIQDDLSGARFRLLSNGVSTSDSYVTLNSYGDALRITVEKGPITVYAHIIDSDAGDNSGKIVVNVTKLN